MLETELQDLIRKGEGAELEFRRDADKNGNALKPEKVAKLITAFANTDGGKILLGVDDDGSISGVQRENMEKWLIDTVIRAHIKPSIQIEYGEVDVDGKKVAVATVPQGTDKPYVVKAKPDGKEKYFVRQESACVRPRGDGMARLFAASGLVSVETMMVRDCEVGNLDAEQVEKYFTRKLNIDEPTWKKEREKILREHHFTLPDEMSGKAYATRLACVLFASTPRRYIPQAGVRVIVDGTKRHDPDPVFMMDERIDLPILGRYDRFYEGRMTVIDKAMFLLKSHIKREKMPDKSPENFTSTRRVFHDYPPDVVEELLVNALAHRDWTNPNTVEVAVYSDCLEVFSPGKLPDGMTVEKMKAGIPAPRARNSKIMQIMRDCYLMKGEGRGIHRFVIPEMLEKNGCEPIFEATDMYLRVILPKRAEG